MDSILTSIKKMLGITEEYTHFDADITMHINSVLMILTQLGVGPDNGFVIEDKRTLWDDFVPGETYARLDAIKSYIYLKVKLLFDPPLSSSAVDAANRMIGELEWRINVAAESHK